jgi:predicted small secreted protein
LKKVKRLLILIAFLLTACGTVQGGGPQSHGGPVQDQVSLIDALRGKSLTVDISGTVSQPFLSPQSGTTIRLSGGPLTRGRPAAV